MYNVVKIDKTKGKVATDVNLATLRDGNNLFSRKHKCYQLDGGYAELGERARYVFCFFHYFI